MSIRTYDRNTVYAKTPPIASIDRVSDKPLPELVPGTWVEAGEVL